MCGIIFFRFTLDSYLLIDILFTMDPKSVLIVKR